MKAYLVTTGLLFGSAGRAPRLARAVAEWSPSSAGPMFALHMTALVALPGALAWWAWRLLRGLSAR